MKTPTHQDRNAAFLHGMWLRSQECAGEGRMLADLTFEVQDLAEKLEAVQDLNKRLLRSEECELLRQLATGTKTYFERQKAIYDPLWHEAKKALALLSEPKL